MSATDGAGAPAAGPTDAAPSGAPAPAPATPAAAPNSPPQDDPTQTAAPQDAADQDPDGSPAERDERGRFRNPVQPRIDELTRKTREAEREAAYWRQRATATPPPPPPAKPKAEDFGEYGDYVEALADWKADEKIDAKLKERDERDKQRQTAERRATTFEGRQNEFKAKQQDYDAVMEAADMPLADHVGEQLFESELGPQIAYHLAKNPSVLARLNEMSPAAAGREIGRLEAKLEQAPPAPAGDPAPSSTPAPAPASAVRTTNAPPPGRALPPGSNAPVDLARLSMDDYIKKRSEQGARWAK